MFKQMLYAQFSSACATLFDFIVTGMLFHFAAFNYVGSTLVGAVSGGVLNCVINYRWTFCGASNSKKTVAWRYLVVWLWSMLLNVWGVTFLVWAVTPAGAAVQLTTLMYSKVLVAVLVAICWNFTMQKYWVYKC